MTAKTNKAKTILQSPKGMYDIMGEDYALYQLVLNKAEEIASYYGFQNIQTPHLEATELFERGVGEGTDLVEKQMYSLKTRGGNKLTLRPEGTAPIMRAYIEHGMQTLPQPVMLQYKGSFFRHEKPQKGRLRELQQFGLETIGEKRAIAEATVIQVVYYTLLELGIKPVIVHINSLGDKECFGSYKKELINHYKKKSKDLCSDCQRRLKTNTLRLLDCKNEKCNEAKQEAPQIVGHLCAPCKQHFKTVLESLEANGIPYILDNYLVRGLDYYSRTVFEFFEDVDAIEGKEIKPLALAAGGRYDYLAKTLGKRDVTAAGGAIGVDRIVQLMKGKKIKPKGQKTPKVFLIQLGDTAKYKSLSIIETFRKAKISLMQSINKDSIKGQLNLASKLNIPYVLIFGQKEVLDNTIIIRNMETRGQETVPIDNVIETIKNYD